MLQILTTGGFGDAAMSLAKMYSKDAPFDPRSIHLTHARIRKPLSDAISEFYTSQGISHRVLQIPDWSWKKRNRRHYDHYLGSSWHPRNINDEVTWEINPLPPLKFDVQDVDLVINPISGRLANRRFSKEQMERYVKECDRKITVIGKAPQEYADFVDKLPVQSLLNKTTIKESVDVICSCHTLVGNPGFVVYLACMAGKKVISTREKNWISNKYFHPDWDVKFIRSL